MTKVSMIHKSSKANRYLVLDLARSRKTTAMTSRTRKMMEVKSNCLPSFSRGIMISGPGWECLGTSHGAKVGQKREGRKGSFVRWSIIYYYYYFSTKYSVLQRYL